LSAAVHCGDRNQSQCRLQRRSSYAQSSPRRVARGPYDLVSTHTKYVPSQLRFLASLDRLIDPTLLDDFVPLLLELARVEGSLYSVPRNIDVRLLHFRTDLIDAAPSTWDELLALAREVNSPPDHYGFIFPGRESGLFGTFFELCEMAGARLFPDNLVPDIENEGGRWALQLLRTFYENGLVPPQLPEWHYDKVHECFRTGHAAMVGDWPGYYSLIATRVFRRFMIVWALVLILSAQRGSRSLMAAAIRLH